MKVKFELSKDNMIKAVVDYLVKYGHVTQNGYVDVSMDVSDPMEPLLKVIFTPKS